MRAAGWLGGARPLVAREAPHLTDRDGQGACPARRSDNAVQKISEIVDGARIGDYDGQRIVECDVSAASTAAVEEAVAAAGVLKKPDDLARIVDPFCKGAGGRWHVEGDERTVRVTQEAMVAAAGEIVEMPHDLARGVDAGGFGAEGGEGIIDGGENAPAEEEGMGVAPRVSPDDLARVVDGKRPGVESRWPRDRRW